MNKHLPYGAVKRSLVGDNGPSVVPSFEPEVFGSATLEPLSPVEVRSFQTFRLTYKVGKLGLDDTGAIRICWRMVSDSGEPQMANPSAANYVTASSNGEGRLALKYDKDGGQRPWNEVLTIIQKGGYLREGQEITIVFGDTSQGSPGMLAQTFTEGGREFRVLADVQATGNFAELPDTQLSIPIVSGPATSWHAVLPTLRRPAESFFLGLKAEDKWGNPTNQAQGQLRFETTLPVNNLPKEIDYSPEDRAMTLEDLSVEEEGELRISVYRDDVLVAEAGPLMIRDQKNVTYWGDLHGQSGETVGTGSLESYLDFARNKAFLDVTSHQANDFQIKDTFWRYLNKCTAEYDEPGRFTVFPGYEWSGNTAVGGDHNVFFRHEGGTIRRCSHALLENNSNTDTDAHTLTDLFQSFRESNDDVVVYAHVGGRYANILYDHDPMIETAVEVHSAWGTFEWVMTDGFPLRRRVGLVCNSDGHKGRPGASYPGDSCFGAYGGLTCFIAPNNDRDAIFEAQRRRHHYGTTGCRMYIDLNLDLIDGGTIFERNPDAKPDTPSHKAQSAIMGDIVKTNGNRVELNVDIRAHAGIERVEIRNGTTVLETVRPYTPKDLGKRIRVLWSGAEYRGRGRNTKWSGRAQFQGTTIEGYETINQWNPDMLFEQRGSNTVVFDTVTTGNFMGFDANLSDDVGTFSLTTNHGEINLEIDQIGFEDTVLDAGGLDRKACVFRLPDAGLPKILSISQPIELTDNGDNPIWICVTTEDGYQAWTSPIYCFQD